LAVEAALMETVVSGVRLVRLVRVGAPRAASRGLSGACSSERRPLRSRRYTAMTMTARRVGLDFHARETAAAVLDPATGEISTVAVRAREQRAPPSAGRWALGTGTTSPTKHLPPCSGQRTPPRHHGHSTQRRLRRMELPSLSEIRISSGRFRLRAGNRRSAHRCNSEWDGADADDQADPRENATRCPARRSHCDERDDEADRRHEESPQPDA